MNVNGDKLCRVRIRLAQREDSPPRLDTAIYVRGRYVGLFGGATEALCKSTTMTFDQAASGGSAERQEHVNRTSTRGRGARAKTDVRNRHYSSP